VIDGKIIWNETVKPNWIRANSSAVNPNIVAPSRLSRPGASSLTNRSLHGDFLSKDAMNWRKARSAVLAGPCAWPARTAAEVLGGSIMPVREAVSRLVADKALEVTPNRAVREPRLRAV
jgi:hypothetical protein